MTFAEYRAMQEQQAQAMPEVEQKSAGQNSAGQNSAGPGAREVLSFAQIAARQSMPAPAPTPAAPAQQAAPQSPAPQQPAKAVVQQPAQPAHPAYAANPYLNPNVEMPEPEPFDVTNLKYAAHTPADPLEHASHVSGRRDTAYDRVYM